MKKTIPLVVNFGSIDYCLDSRPYTYLVCRKFVNDQFPLVNTEKPATLTVSTRKIKDGVRVHLELNDDELYWALDKKYWHEVMYMFLERELKPFMGKEDQKWVWVHIKNTDEK